MVLHDLMTWCFSSSPARVITQKHCHPGLKRALKMHSSRFMECRLHVRCHQGHGVYVVPFRREINSRAFSVCIGEGQNRFRRRGERTEMRGSPWGQRCPLLGNRNWVWGWESEQGRGKWSDKELGGSWRGDQDPSHRLWGESGVYGEYGGESANLSGWGGGLGDWASANFHHTQAKWEKQSVLGQEKAKV